MRILLLVGAILVVDRATKEIAVHTLASRRRGFLRAIVNQRPLLVRGSSPRTLVMLWVAAIGCAVGALICTPELRENALVTAGIAAVLAGAAGNLVDRLAHGAIVDFIAIGRWPTFNLADVAIIGGATVAGASLL